MVAKKIFLAGDNLSTTPAYVASSQPVENRAVAPLPSPWSIVIYSPRPWYEQPLRRRVLHLLQISPKSERFLHPGSPRQRFAPRLPTGPVIEPPRPPAPPLLSTAGPTINTSPDRTHDPCSDPNLTELPWPFRPPSLERSTSSRSVLELRPSLSHPASTPLRAPRCQPERHQTEPLLPSIQSLPVPNTPVRCSTERLNGHHSSSEPAAASSVMFSAAISMPKWPTSKSRSHVDFRLKTKNIPWCRRSLKISASISAPSTELKTGPDDLVTSILSKVLETDRGVSLEPERHKEVAEVATELQKYCISEPVKSPLIFGVWDVVYCSNPTSPGGGYRSAVGRLFFRTKEMVQALEAPDVVRNKVSFSLLGFLDGQVSLKGKLKALDDEWIQVIFEAPELQIGGLEFSYGGQSEVKLQIIYIDEKIRLGKGSRGSLFVFQRR